MKRIGLAITVGVALALLGTAALAGRNTAGTYTLPAGNPVVPGPITRAWANSTLSDIGTEMTNSLDRLGRGGMEAALACIDGSAPTPGISFGNELSTGLYRIGAHDVGLAIGGSKAWEHNAYGQIETGWLEVLGTTQLAGSVTASGGLTENGWVEIVGTLSVTGKIDRPSLPSVGAVVSSSTGTWSTSGSAWYTAVSVTITTTGRPVMVIVQPDTSGYSRMYCTVNGGAAVQLTRDGAILAGGQYVQDQQTYLNPGLAQPIALDVNVPAGTHTYALQGNALSASVTLFIYDYVLVAYEL